MNLKKIVLAAPGSGSGKTTVTCALLQYCVEEHKKVSAFKCGPDYIDPMFHRKVMGIPSENLDTFFVDKHVLKDQFERCMREKGSDLAVIEGVMGLFDGLGGTSLTASTYEVAEAVDANIILIVDAHGMGGRSLAALIAGFLKYDTGKRIKAVILNKTSKAFVDTVTPMLEEELGIAVLGCFPKSNDLGLESRHLGLKLPEEVADLQDKLKKAAEILRANVDLDKLQELAKEENIADANNDRAADVSNDRGNDVNNDRAADLSSEIQTENAASKSCSGLRLAVARDEAFCFYYEENLRILRNLGVELVPFSPIHDKKLPENVSGLLLGGGYPELYGAELSANQEMLQDVKNAVLGGMPTLAECGGFMYLHETLTDSKGAKYPMVGAIQADVQYAGKLVRFGYVELAEKPKQADMEEMTDCTNKESKKSHKLNISGMRAHEFHYFDSTANGNDVKAVKPITGRSWECCHVSENSCLGFPHLYYASKPEFAQSFVAGMKEFA